MFKLDLEKADEPKIKLSTSIGSSKKQESSRKTFSSALLTTPKPSQSYGFSSSHVWMWELDYKESWAPKNWCFWTVVLEKILESPLDNKEIQLGDQS